MEHKIIHTENYLLILSDEEIKDVRPVKGRWHLEDGLTLNQFPTYLTDLSDCKLVEYYLPLNGAKPLDGVIELPELEDESFTESKLFCYSGNGVNEKFQPVFRRVFRDGYNKAREKYRFTEEDMIAFGRWIISNENFENTSSWSRDTSIHHLNNWKSLQQPRYPTHFEFEMELKQIRPGSTSLYKSIVTTTNHLGQTVAVGTYKFK